MSAQVLDGVQIGLLMILDVMAAVFSPRQRLKILLRNRYSVHLLDIQQSRVILASMLTSDGCRYCTVSHRLLTCRGRSSQSIRRYSPTHGWKAQEYYLTPGCESPGMELVPSIKALCSHLRRHRVYPSPYWPFANPDAMQQVHMILIPAAARGRKRYQ
jgi:hypothetical protein